VAENKKTIINAAKSFRNKTGYQILAKQKQDKVIINSVGVSGHSANPGRGQNAIMQLLLFLQELPIEQGDLKSLIDFLAEKIGMQTNGDNLGIGLSDEISGALAFNAGTIDLDETKFSMGINIRIPVKYKANDVIEPLKKTMNNNGIEIRDLRFREPLYYPEDHALIQTLKKVYTEQTGQEATLISMSGGTYAKAMPNIVAFGPSFPSTTYYAHKPDECIGIDELIKLTKIYAHTI